jgi:hypothetical protein
VNRDKYVIAVYVMTYDVTKPFSEERYRLSIKGFGKPIKSVRFYDPLLGKDIPLKVMKRGKELAVEISAVDYPRLIVVSG